MFSIGFTGTSKGMTPKQAEAVQQFLKDIEGMHAYSMVHHGDCIGADEQFDYFAHKLDIPIFIHPPENPIARAFCNQKHDATVFAPRPYLERNKAIVEAASYMLATPKEMVEELRSGTWMTIRHSKKMKKPIRIFWPDGSETYFK